MKLPVKIFQMKMTMRSPQGVFSKADDWPCEVVHHGSHQLAHTVLVGAQLPSLQAQQDVVLGGGVQRHQLVDPVGHAETCELRRQRCKNSGSLQWKHGNKLSIGFKISMFLNKGQRSFHANQVAHKAGWHLSRHFPCKDHDNLFHMDSTFQETKNVTHI